MLKDDELVGAISIYRPRSRPFTDKQIALVTNFAAQAVIAIENTRLLNELRTRTDDLTEALEQQTATSEVLQVISSSPGELEPVFQAMLENAVQLCEAQLRYAAADIDDGAFDPVAMYNAPRAYGIARQRGRFVPQAGNRTLASPVEDQAAGRTIADQPSEIRFRPRCRRQARRCTNAVLGRPMLKDEELIGAITIYRQEVRPFTDKQIELVENFAAQAVIAIENTRLLNELRQRTDDLTEALEQQTATSDVLQVISSSPGDLSRCSRRCWRTRRASATPSSESVPARAGTGDRFAARHAAAFAELRRPSADIGPVRPVRDSSSSRAATSTFQLSHRSRTLSLTRRSRRSSPVTNGGARTLLVVPMLKDDELIGAIGIYRQEVRPFADKQIELVRISPRRPSSRSRTRGCSTNCASAPKTCQKRWSSRPRPRRCCRSSPARRATRTRVPGHAAERGAHLRSQFRSLFRFENGAWRAGAMFGVPPPFAEFWNRGPQRPGPRTALGRVVETRQSVHIADVTMEPAYVEGEPRSSPRSISDAFGRSSMFRCSRKVS